MSKVRCPGQDMRFWQPGDIFELPCSKCGKMIEFFKDDVNRKCSNCGSRIENPKISMGCAQWCEHAEECLGYDPSAILSEIDDASKGTSLSGKILNSIKQRFGEESSAYKSAEFALDKAMQLLKGESANPKIVTSTVLLMNIDTADSNADDTGSPMNKFLPIARGILEDAGLDKNTIDDICEMIRLVHEGVDIDTPEFRIISEVYKANKEKTIN